MRFSRNNANLILLGGADFGVAGFEATIWRSTDAGLSWTKVFESATGTVERVTDLEIIEDGTDQNMVAAWNSESGDNIGGALRSTDDGASGLTLPLACLRSSVVHDCALRPPIRRALSCPPR